MAAGDAIEALLAWSVSREASIRNGSRRIASRPIATAQRTAPVQLRDAAIDSQL
jgi:hypothetical protein